MRAPAARIAVGPATPFEERDRGGRYAGRPIKTPPPSRHGRYARRHRHRHRNRHDRRQPRVEAVREAEPQAHLVTVEGGVEGKRRLAGRRGHDEGASAATAAMPPRTSSRSAATSPPIPAIALLTCPTVAASAGAMPGATLVMRRALPAAPTETVFASPAVEPARWRLLRPRPGRGRRCSCRWQRRCLHRMRRRWRPARPRRRPPSPWPPRPCRWRWH